MAIRLHELNALDREDFVSRLGAIYEHSPWVAARVWPAHPFDSVDQLWRAMQDAVTAASAKSSSRSSVPTRSLPAASPSPAS